MDPGAAANSLASAKFKADGRAGTFRLAVLGDASGASDAFKADKVAALGGAKLNLMGRVETDDGAALIELLTLDRYISVDRRPGRLALTAKGTLDGALDVDSQLTAGPLAISTNGRVRISPQASPRAELDFKLSNANIRSPRPVTGGRLAELVPVSLATRLALAEGTLRLADIRGTVAGAALGGRLAIGMQRPMTIEGEIDLAAIDLPSAIATGVGVPVRAAGAGADPGMLWPTEPFEQMLGPLSGRVSVKSARVTLTPKLEARDFKGVLHFGESQIALQITEAGVAGGRVTGELIFLRDREGLYRRALASHWSAPMPPSCFPATEQSRGGSGWTLRAEGAGMSAVALVGSLEGGGTFTLENGRVARLDPRAFEIVMRAVDQGLPIEFEPAAGENGFRAGERHLGHRPRRRHRHHCRRSSPPDQCNGRRTRRRARVQWARQSGRQRYRRTAAPVERSRSRRLAERAARNRRGAQGRSQCAQAEHRCHTFASWLALRAVEQQSKKLDVLERRELSVSVTGPADQRQPEQTATQGAPASPPARRRPLRPGCITPASTGAERPKAKTIDRGAGSAGDAAGGHAPPVVVRRAMTMSSRRALKLTPERADWPSPHALRRVALFLRKVDFDRSRARTGGSPMIDCRAGAPN